MVSMTQKAQSPVWTHGLGEGKEEKKNTKRINYLVTLANINVPLHLHAGPTKHNLYIKSMETCL